MNRRLKAAAALMFIPAAQFAQEPPSQDKDTAKPAAVVTHCGDRSILGAHWVIKTSTTPQAQRNLPDVTVDIARKDSDDGKGNKSGELTINVDMSGYSYAVRQERDFITDITTQTILSTIAGADQKCDATGDQTKPKTPIVKTSMAYHWEKPAVDAPK